MGFIFNIVPIYGRDKINIYNVLQIIFPHHLPIKGYTVKFKRFPPLAIHFYTHTIHTYGRPHLRSRKWTLLVAQAQNNRELRTY